MNSANVTMPFTRFDRDGDRKVDVRCQAVAAGAKKGGTSMSPEDETQDQVRERRQPVQVSRLLVV